MNAVMKIGEAAASVGLPQKTIRYYEDIGLVAPLRSDNGFRYFRPSDVQALALVKNARDLGFSLAESKTLLELYQNPNRSNAAVKEFTTEHLKRIEEKIEHLTNLHDQLSDMTKRCNADGKSECAILDSLVDLH
ncbi:MerR family transcriptional regulator [Kordiimonas lipolytica]|uniref:HTH-type transcriptional regulator CueR n=1 Tax=Kordiimonas lipolytica TaxID=1662421 RepID=A0ABV8UFA9_9PROT|nr:MerR family transcriptional regulator [Kordiimonas lipolytica]